MGPYPKKVYFEDFFFFFKHRTALSSVVFKLSWRVEDFLKGQLGTGKVGEQAKHPTRSYMRVFVPNCVSSTWHTEYFGMHE